MDKKKHKRLWQIAVCVCIAAVVVFFAIMPMLAKQDPETDAPKPSILSGTVQTGSICRELVGGGTLTEDEAVVLTMPAAVKLKDFLLRNGDVVTKGTPIATVDRITAMTAISQVQEMLDQLAQQIEAAANKGGTEAVTASSGGTVKILYAAPGDPVRNVMLEHGALAVLSLDDLLAVDIRTDSDLRAGKPMTVTFSDGKAVDGRVAKNLNGVMTVTIEDQGYTLGDTVEVTTANGVYLGSDELYIYSPWNVTAYAGTVGSIRARVGDRLSAGSVLMDLKNTGNPAVYGQLVDRRQEYEELMQVLLEMHQTEALTAPCDGILAGIDLNSPQLLSADNCAPSPLTGSDGEILYTDALALVSPQNTMTLEILVDELDIRALEEGMTAQVQIDSLGGVACTATIAAIGNTGSNHGGSSKFPVVLTMERTERMLSGMNATATVTLSTVSDALTVPAAALVDQGNQALVYTGYDEKKEMLLDPIAVRVGISDGETVEILEGLSEGQTYYYAYYDTLEISATPDFGSSGSVFH